MVCTDMPHHWLSSTCEGAEDSFAVFQHSTVLYVEQYKYLLVTSSCHTDVRQTQYQRYYFLSMYYFPKFTDHPLEIMMQVDYTVLL